MLCDKQKWDVLLQSYANGLQSQHIACLTVSSEINRFGFTFNQTIERTALLFSYLQTQVETKVFILRLAKGVQRSQTGKPRFGAWTSNRLARSGTLIMETGNPRPFWWRFGALLCWLGGAWGVGMSSCRSFVACVSRPAGSLPQCLSTLRSVNKPPIVHSVRTASCGKNADSLEFPYSECQAGPSWSYSYPTMSVSYREAHAASIETASTERLNCRLSSEVHGSDPPRSIQWGGGGWHWYKALMWARYSGEVWWIPAHIPHTPHTFGNCGWQKGLLCIWLWWFE